MAGTRAFDKSGTGNYGTLTSGPQRTVGKIGQALSFDGVDDDVAIINRTSFDFNLTDPFSVSAWVYHKDKVYGNIVIKQGTGPTCTGYELSVDRDASPDINSNSVFFYFTSDSGANNKLKVATPANSLLPGAWHHVAMAYNGNTKASGVRIYIDGVSQTLTTNIDSLTGATTVAADLLLNAPHGVGNGSLKGLLDDIRVYNRSLSADEIKRLYNLGGTVKLNSSLNANNNNSLQKGLVGWWTFDGEDRSNTTTYDRSGKGYKGTMTTTSVAQSMPPVVGKIGQGLEFSNSRYVDVISTSNYSELKGSSQLTISFWAKKRVNAASAGLVGGDFGAQTAGAELFLTRDNTDSDGTSPADSMQFHLND